MVQQPAAGVDTVRVVDTLVVLRDSVIATVSDTITVAVLASADWTDFAALGLTFGLVAVAVAAIVIEVRRERTRSREREEVAHAREEVAHARVSGIAYALRRNLLATFEGTEGGLDKLRIEVEHEWAQRAQSGFDVIEELFFDLVGEAAHAPPDVRKTVWIAFDQFSKGADRINRILYGLTDKTSEIAPKLGGGRRQIRDEYKAAWEEFRSSVDALTDAIRRDLLTTIIRPDPVLMKLAALPPAAVKVDEPG